MFVACWSAKGGSGTTVVAAGITLTLAETGTGVLAVDLCGDLPGVLGLPDPDAPGVSDWLAAGPGVPLDGLARLEGHVAEGLALVPRGGLPLSEPARAEVLAALLAEEARHVVVDCGRVAASAPSSAEVDSDPAAEVVRILVSSAGHSLFVTRACYLSLRRYLTVPVRPSGIVLLTEAGRSLTAYDVEEVCAAPVVAQVAIEPSVARAVDAGLLGQRLPRGLARTLRQAA